MDKKMDNIKREIQKLYEEIAEIDVELANWHNLVGRGPIGDSYITRLESRKADCFQALAQRQSG